MKQFYRNLKSSYSERADRITALILLTMDMGLWGTILFLHIIKY